MAEIVPVVSEALEAQVRNLLPSQRGFGEDLQASNVIMPIIDLTAAAEGSNVPQYQAQALALGSQTSFIVSNTTTTLANSPGFYLISGNYVVQNTGSAIWLSLTDGLTSKKIYEIALAVANANITNTIYLVVFLASGESVTATSTGTGSNVAVTVRQLADVNGVVVNPAGFTPQ